LARVLCDSLGLSRTQFSFTNMTLSLKNTILFCNSLANMSLCHNTILCCEHNLLSRTQFFLTNMTLSSLAYQYGFLSQHNSLSLSQKQISLTNVTLSLDSINNMSLCRYHDSHISLSQHDSLSLPRKQFSLTNMTLALEHDSLSTFLPTCIS